MDLGIAGKRAAVAASSRGLGFATAAALAGEGVQVALCSRDKERIEDAAALIGELATPIVADVATPDGAADFVAAARDRLGGVDILVANAGGPPPGDFASTADIAAYRDAFSLNALSTIAMCQSCVPEMQHRGWGRVVAITSIAVRQPIPSLILSNTARAGLTGFLKTLAREVARDGVTVNSLQPGLHATERVAQLHAENVDPAAGILAGRIGSPEEFGAVAAFLCSEQAAYMTGCAIPVDGGAYGGLQ
jgi:3-oxoacyl-[acyl-carrier protein] reductase